MTSTSRSRRVSNATDVLVSRGLAELRLNRQDAAEKDFAAALKSDPSLKDSIAAERSKIRTVAKVATKPEAPK